MVMATLLDIALHREPRGAMIGLDEALVTREHGVADDYRGSPGWRQVTVLSREAWTCACETVVADLDWTTRRANLLVEGIDLMKTTRRLLQIGDLVLEVTGESRPCERMDEACDGLLVALQQDWRGGVCCRVVQNARIQVGDRVVLADRVDRAPPTDTSVS